MGPRLGVAPGHNGGAMARALLSPGNPRPDEQDPLCLELFIAPLAVGKVAIAPIDDNVPLFQKGQQMLDKFIDWIARLHHQHHPARPLQTLHKPREVMGPHHLFPLGRPP